MNFHASREKDLQPSAAGRKAVLEAKDLSIGYHHRGRPIYTVAGEISASLRPGELICLIGPNGSGKTTLLRTLSGMLPPVSGSIRVNGQSLEGITSRELSTLISVVLTERPDTGFLSAFTLASLGRHPYTDWRGRISSEDEAVIHRAFRTLGAENLACRIFAELSDGEKQRIMIIRALVQETPIMVLDEPTAFLDLPGRVETIHNLREITRLHGIAVLLSTHDLDLALRNADRIWLMGAGSQITTGTPEDLVLDGSIDRAFSRENFRFDPEHGSFLPPRKNLLPILVRETEGVSRSTAIWTRRALERMGYKPEAPGEGSSSTPTLIIESDKLWRLEREAESGRAESGRTETRCRSIGEVLDALSSSKQ